MKEIPIFEAFNYSNIPVGKLMLSEKSIQKSKRTSHRDGRTRNKNEMQHER